MGELDAPQRLWDTIDMLVADIVRLGKRGQVVPHLWEQARVALLATPEFGAHPELYFVRQLTRHLDGLSKRVTDAYFPPEGAHYAVMTHGDSRGKLLMGIKHFPCVYGRRAKEYHSTDTHGAWEVLAATVGWRPLYLVRGEYVQSGRPLSEIPATTREVVRRDYISCVSLKTGQDVEVVL